MPQATAYYADGTPIPEEALGEAVQSGAAHFEEGSKVHVRTADGKAGTVDAADVPAMLASGGVLEAPSSISAQEEAARKAESLKPYEGVAQRYIQYQESLANAATFGGYAALAREVAPEYAEGMQKRREAMPFSAAYADVVGAGGTMVYGGLAGGGAVAGTGALARLSQAISAPGRAVAAVGRGAEALALGGARAVGIQGTGALGRMGLSAIGTGSAGLAEGAFLGAGTAVQDAALHDQPITVDKLLTGAKHGAILGGVGGSVLGGIGAGGKEALRRVLGGETFGEALAGFAEKRAFKALTGNARKFYDRAGAEGVQRSGRKLLDRGIPLTNVDDAQKAIDDQLEHAVQRMKTVADTLDGAGIKPDVRKMLLAVDEQAAKLREVPLEDFQLVAQKVESQVAPLRRAVEGHGGEFQVKKGPTFESSTVDVLEEAAPPKEFTFGEFWKVRQNLDKTIKWSSQQRNPSTEALRDLRTTFDDALTEATQGAGDDVSRAWLGAKEDYHDFRNVADAVEDLVVRMEKNRFHSPSDYASGALGFLGALTGGVGTFGALISGAVSSQAHKLAREKGPGIVARVADSLSKTDRRLATTAKAIITGDAAELPARKALPAASVQVGEAVAEATKPRAPARAAPKADPFSAQVATLYQYQTNPARSRERMAQAFADVARDYPELASALMARIEGDIQWLTAELPQPHTRADSSLTPDRELPRVAPFERGKFLRKVAALDDPEAVFADVARGKIDHVAIDALKQRRPALWEDMRERVVRGALSQSEAWSKLGYRRRISISLAFEFQGDKSLTPEVLGSIQQGYADQAAGAEDPSKPGPKPSADVDPKIAEDSQTMTQRLAAGGM